MTSSFFQRYLHPSLTALLLTAAAASVHAADNAETQRMVGGEDRVEQSGPTGMPATTGSGGSADTKNTVTDAGQQMGVGVETFFSKASEQSVAAIASAKLAQEKGSAPIQGLASEVLAQEQERLQQLQGLAEQTGVETEENPALSAQAERWALKWNDDAQFDAAYLEHQITAQQQAIDLYQRAAQIDNRAVADFADEQLPELQAQLQKTQQLADRSADSAH